SHLDERGSTSYSACPCHRAVAFTPPRWECRISQISAHHAAFTLRKRARPSDLSAGSRRSVELSVGHLRGGGGALEAPSRPMLPWCSGPYKTKPSAAPAGGS